MNNLKQLQGEEWRKHSIGVYVSNKGRIYIPSYVDSIGRQYDEKYTYGTIRKDGYRQVSRNGKDYLVHRLVAESFVQNIDNLPIINHIDENKNNNFAENLEWCSYSYNLSYNGIRYRAAKNRDYNAIVAKKDYIEIHKKGAPKRCKKITQKDLSGNIIRTFDSINEAIKLGFNGSAISMCLHNKRKQHKGYLWELYDLKLN